MALSAVGTSYSAISYWQYGYSDPSQERDGSAQSGAPGSGTQGAQSGSQAQTSAGLKPAKDSEKGDRYESEKDGRQQLSEEEQREVEKLRQRDTEVRAHEQAHIAAGGQYVKGGAKYSFQSGPDGKQYAVGGEVGIDSSPVKGNPQATIAKMEQIRRAALAPANPSGQDRGVAAAAASSEAQARQQAASEGASAGGAGGPPPAGGKPPDAPNGADKPPRAGGPPIDGPSIPTGGAAPGMQSLSAAKTDGNAGPLSSGAHSGDGFVSPEPPSKTSRYTAGAAVVTRSLDCARSTVDMMA